MEFCHITPTPHLKDFGYKRKAHLLLAHLVEDDLENNTGYAMGYIANKRHTDKEIGMVYILDNSAFEMFQQKKPMFEPNRLIDIGDMVSANYIVMSDYPNEHSSKTIQAAQKLAPLFKNKGFGTFFVPQSCSGDFEDYVNCFAWAASSPLIDYIGLSIIGVPNAFGDLQTPLQRYMARYKMMIELEKRGLLQLAKRNKKKIHLLGMLDGPNEIELMFPFDVDTWDSSAAIWNGLKGVAFDNSPTGLKYGKHPEHVDFNFKTTDQSKIDLALMNMAYIDDLVAQYNKTVEATSKTTNALVNMLRG